MNTSQEPIIIIGAGVAGLTAASELKKMGEKVLVLEARDRLGGRIFSQKIKHECYDLGASWIHGIQNNPIWSIVQHNQIQTTVFNYDQSIYYQGKQQPFNSEEKLIFETSLDYLLNRFKEIDPHEHYHHALAALQLWMNEEEFLLHINTQFDLDEHAVAKLKKMLSDFFNLLAEDPCASDLAHLSADFWKNEGYYPGDEVIFPQGYIQVIEFLSRNIRVLTNKVVQNIDYTQDTIQIFTENGEYFSASQVIVTVPLGVLKKQRLQFFPDLSQEKKQVINNLGFGTFNKLFVSFDQNFWKSAQYDQSKNIYIHNQHGWLNFLDVSELYHQPTLLFLFGGESAIWLENTSCEEVWHNIKTSLTLVFDEIPQPIQIFKTEWGKDQFSEGSFSYHSVGQTSDQIEILKQPIQNKVFFAGEHLALFGAGTVHGAYHSGLEVSEAIQKYTK
ncbi:hypothetical protein F889_00742 [Acinetobacter colistiniresistens]|uniref:Tryptophan 2-monooxygenase n=1 Tax=Acinetobacter colistiniresistens TaxID=280145 RepID=N9R949_9GAMM|nr:NAD(P)/FAD-dependent oxidoreductase [Acinetobacter colistiniresistens]ENX35667.1 hypothetical protein F889_00742 [Acinetobacter colistiniresistens]